MEDLDEDPMVRDTFPGLGRPLKGPEYNIAPQSYHFNGGRFQSHVNALCVSTLLGK